MPSSTDCWGIEVGSAAIKAVRLKRTGNDVAVEDFDVIPFKKVLTSPDVDADEQVRVGLDQFVARHDLSKATVVVSVPGHMAFARFAKLPPVEPKKIPDIVKFEAVQQIPFPIEQVEWDYQTFQDEDSPEVEVGIFAITKDRLLPWLANFQQAGISIHAISLSPVAAFNALNYDLDLEDRPSGTIIMDIGTSATDLIITENGRIWLRTIPIGGNHFTDALVKNFNLSFSKAEKLKREAASSKYARQIFTAMRPVFVDLVQEVQKSLGYYQSLNRDAELTQLTGLGQTFRLPGLQTFLKQQLQVEVNRLDNYKKIEAEGRDAAKFAENVLSLAPAYGLALQGLDEQKVSCNLLPTPVIRGQVWKAKQPAFVAAAVVAVLAAGLAYGGLMMERGAYEAQEDVRDDTDRLVDAAQDARREWEDKIRQSDPRQKIQNVQSTDQYRQFWQQHLLPLQEEILLSVNPQQAILDRDEQAMDAIPRDQLRYLVFEQVAVTYLLPLDGEVDWEQNAPTYRIEIAGFTPKADAAVFITESVFALLEQLEDDPQRPYTVEVNARSLTVTPVVGEDRPTRATTVKRDRLPGQAGSPTQTPEDLGPRDSQYDVPQPGDTRFEFVYIVKLRPPDYQPPAEAPAPDAEAADVRATAEANIGDQS